MSASTAASPDGHPGHVMNPALCTDEHALLGATCTAKETVHGPIVVGATQDPGQPAEVILGRWTDGNLTLDQAKSLGLQLVELASRLRDSKPRLVGVPTQKRGAA